MNALPASDDFRSSRFAGVVGSLKDGLAEPEGFEPSIGLYNPITV